MTPSRSLFSYDEASIHLVLENPSIDITSKLAANELVSLSELKASYTVKQVNELLFGKLRDRATFLATQQGFNYHGAMLSRTLSLGCQGVQHGSTLDLIMPR